MRVGSVVYSTWQGLGVLAKSFYDAGVVTDVVVVRHGRRPENDDWYPGAPRIADINRDYNVLYDLIDRVDVMLYFETPFVWSAIEYARSKGVKTVLMPMYECMRETLPYQPDAFLNPSLLDQGYYPQGTYIPIPVEGVEWRQRTRAEVFVHNAGNGGLKGRNGTKEVLDALNYIKSGARFIIRSQEPLVGDGSGYTPRTHQKIDLRISGQSVERGSLYGRGDVFLFPERFNGLSLPLQEAYASGMAVMATDRFPNNTYLPTEPLIPVSAYVKNRIGGCNVFDDAVVDPKTIAAMVDSWFGRDITELSLRGKAWADAHSWAALKPKYISVLQGVIDGR